MIATLLLLSCAGNIAALYEDEKTAVLSDPGPAPANWEPELRARISGDALQTLASEAVSSGLLGYKETIEVNNPLGVEVKVTPKASIKELKVAVGSDCGGCLAVTARLKGNAKYKAGGLSGKVPFTAKVGGTLAFELEEEGKGWTVTGELVEIDKVKLESDLVGTLDVTEFLGDWTRKALEKAPPISLGKIGGDQMPLRAVRLGSVGDALEIQALTQVVGGEAVNKGSGSVGGAWELRMHEDTALAMARRKAFELGTIDYEVAIDPRTLVFDGTGFTLGLRLWRLKGAGWWREYSVTGNIAMVGKRIKLTPGEATEGEKSKGAGLADPLALLGEGLILEAVTDGVKQAFPASTSAKIGDQKIGSRVKSMTGRNGVLIVQGDLITNFARGSIDSPIDNKAGRRGGR